MVDRPGPALRLLPAPDPAGDGLEGTVLRNVVEEFELEGFVYPAQGVQDQLVGEPGVLREQRAVHVGTVGVEAPGALGAVLAVVAVTYDNFAERLCVFTEVGSSAVVLEAYDLARLAGLGSQNANQHVPDQTLFVRFPWLGMQIEDADAWELLALRRFV